MPAGSHSQGSMSALRRLVQQLSAWRQRRVARRRARLHSFMGLSDRTLADIGVQRAQVYGALIGAMPLGGNAAPAEEFVCEAVVYELPRPPKLTVVKNELNTAA
jgi:uncharacterized protein YjiS (DUF1127 family)